MTPTDKPQFLKILLGLKAIKPGHPLCEEGLELYWNAMQDWTLEHFRNAANHLARSCEFMPNPYHFEQLRKASRLTAGEAWSTALGACSSAIQHGRVTNAGTCGEELIDRAVRAIGGYGVIAMCDTDKLLFLERRFCEHYEALRSAHDTRLAVPELTRQSADRLRADMSACS